MPDFRVRLKVNPKTRKLVFAADVHSVFDIDTMKAIRDEICKLANTQYQTNEKNDISIRLITDHIRSSTFLISDGVISADVNTIHDHAKTALGKDINDIFYDNEVALSKLNH